MIRSIPLWCALFFLFACGNNADEKEEAALPPLYFYYPRANVYFDSANKEYLFQAQNDTSWQSAKQIPAVVQSMMDKSVQIQDSALPVWRNNANHRLLYSALLYATPNDTVAKKPELNQAVRQKPGASSTPAAKKEKKGLGRFIDKIFGRKKKEKKDGQ